MSSEGANEMGNMTLQRSKVDILDDAILALTKETGVQLQVKQVGVQIHECLVDAILCIPGVVDEIPVEIKKWAPQANLEVLIHRLTKLPTGAMLVADYVNPNMADRLKAANIQFIDALGNAYVNTPPTYFFIKGHKPTERAAKTATNRAFDTTGLKVVFAFLCNPHLVNSPYRDIAHIAGVALGTVGWVVAGLKDAGFLIDRGTKRGRRLTNLQKLLDRWAEAYPEKLKPKLTVGEFVAKDPNWWKALDIEKYSAYWGGEVAAAIYTDYLQPQIATVYLPKNVGNKLFADAQLRKLIERTGNEAGLVEIYRPFWPRQQLEKPELPNDTLRPGLVHPVLAYADLLTTGDTRNLETAEIIYENYIAQHLGKA